MTDTRITDRAVNNLRIVEFFDPNAAFNYGTKTELSLVSRDGYELVFKGDDFAFDSKDRPTDGTVKDVFLYDPDGHLVGRIDDASFSLEDYYDQVAVDGKSGAFTADLMAGDDKITGGFARDHLEGYDGNDKISGGQGDDLLEGGKGNDELLGSNGFDDIDGGAGDDVVSGGAGNDLIFGFDGNDTLSGNAGDDSIAGEAGDDNIKGGFGDDDLEGGAGKDKLLGQQDDDLMGGGGAKDKLTGGEGNDELYGDKGDDVLKGSVGNDSLDGGDNDDKLYGGAGGDLLRGGLGADEFHFQKQSDGADVVADFDTGGDKLVFNASGFDNMDQDFDLVVGVDPTASSGKGTFLYDTSSQQLFWDADGKGGDAGVLVARLDDVASLSKDDFVINS